MSEETLPDDLEKERIIVFQYNDELGEFQELELE